MGLIIHISLSVADDCVGYMVAPACFKQENKHCGKSG